MGPKALAAFAAAYPQAFFVEIGSNDGSKHDHLKHLIRGHPWRGVMVEPVPFVFERLRANYGELDRVALEQVAIADSEGALPFFHLAEASAAEQETLPDYYDALGSFSREVVAGHVDAIPDIEERIIEITVPAIRFETLLGRQGDPGVDLLLIDVEGYDWELLQSIDLERHRPRLVVFEHYHLSAADQDAARGRFTQLGYDVRREVLDTWCLDLSPNDELSAAWGRLPDGMPAVSAFETAG